jgi:hypothetical protein
MTSDLHVLMAKLDRAMGIAAEPKDGRGSPPGREWSLHRAAVLVDTTTPKMRTEWRWYVDIHYTSQRAAETPETALQNALNDLLEHARGDERANENRAKAARDRLADLRRAIES